MSFIGWILAVIAAGVLASAGGADRGFVAEAASLALAPALASLVLLPRLGEPAAAAAALLAWVLAGAGLVAGGGGVISPFVAMLSLGPPLAMALGRAWAGYAGAGAVLAYAGGAALAPLETRPAVLLGGFPELLALLALAYAAALLMLVRGGAMAAKPAEDAAFAQRVAEVSHELRTPITHIIGFAELIERQLFGPVEARYVEYAGLIRRSASQLLELINAQLDASRIAAGRYDLEIAEFDARAIVEEVVAMAADAAARKAIALSTWLPDPPLTVRADAGALRRMLINTLGNAVKFTPDDGRVIVAARAAGSMLVLETIDNGPGISAADKQKLGAPFERGAGGARAEGTGLGLSLARALAELHGGSLSFHDAPGGGALVRIELPVLEVERTSNLAH